MSHDRPGAREPIGGIPRASRAEGPGAREPIGGIPRASRAGSFISPVVPDARDGPGPRERSRDERGSVSPARPSARDGRSAAGRIQTFLYRHRWLRWAAAAGAALIVLISLGGGRTGPPPEPAESLPPAPAGLLPPGTRGVPVPVDSGAFAEHDSVDVHAVLDGTAVVRNALIVGAGEDEVVVAVPVEQVDATVTALATGGVMLILVPAPQS